MSSWQKLIGTQTGTFILGLLGVRLKNNAGSLQVRDNGDTAFADVELAKLKINDVDTVTIQASPSQTGPYTLTLPVDDGSPSQVLSTDGSGVLSWVSAASTDACWKVDSTSFVFGSTSPVTMFTLPANAVIDKVTVIVDTAFDGTPTMSVGVNGGSASKYVSSGDVNLLVADRYDIPNQSVPVGSTEALEITYSAGGATAGAGRVLVTYAIPT